MFDSYLGILSPVKLTHKINHYMEQEHHTLFWGKCGTIVKLRILQLEVLNVPRSNKNGVHFMRLCRVKEEY